MIGRIFILGMFLAVAPPAFAADKINDAVVVELFTSQSCSSCPPADAYLQELNARHDIIALEYHVDYWDKTLSFSGSWKDRFSKPEWTQRQNTYANLISGGGVYTPQMVADGRFQAVGSRRDDVEEIIEKAKNAKSIDFDVVQEKSKNGSVGVTIKGNPEGRPLELVFVRVNDRTATDIPSGENKGSRLVNTNIVSGLTSLGSWYGGKMTFWYPANSLVGGESCYLLLQDKVNRRIAAARPCIINVN